MPDSDPIKVTVRPAQAAYFAGETLQVTITYTNTRTPEANAHQATPRSASYGHKRASHSISSVPLSRPPTSPGLVQRTPTAPKQPGTAPARARKGLIGKNASRSNGDESSHSKEVPARRRHPARSMSVALGSEDVKGLNGSLDSGPTSSSSRSSITAPKVSSPLARDPSLPTRHPHARKQSVMDGQVLLMESSTPTSTSFPASASSVSSFNVSLDTISEASPSTAQGATFPPTPSASSPYPQSTFFGMQEESRSGFLSYPPRSSHSSLKPEMLGSSASPSSKRSISASFTQPASEVLLYTYAHVVGTMELSPAVSTVACAELYSALRKTTPKGGGSMNITQRGSHRRRHSSIFAGGGGGLLSRASSLLSSSVSSPVGLSDNANGINEDAPLPTLDTQPAMIAVDLTLAPGQSKTYIYRIELPPILPPTFRGRSVRFAYNLVLGTCRSTDGGGSNSRVMHVPLRVYNNVTVSRPQRPYDLLWPVARRREGNVSGVVTESLNPNTSATSIAPDDTFDGLHSYAHRLSSASHGRTASSHSDSHDEDDAQVHDCRESVEILSRNTKKASYDVNKDGAKVAVLTLVKSAYRLGETVLGIVEINIPGWRARVLKLSAFLETQESLPSPLNPSPSTRPLKRVHAEVHRNQTLATTRTIFTLEIPPEASPTFAIESHDSRGGLEWKLRMSLLVALVPGPDTELRHLVRDGLSSAWGAEWRASSNIAPQVLPEPVATTPTLDRPALPARSSGMWSSMLASFLSGEREYHDGDEESDDETLPSQRLHMEDHDDEPLWKELPLENVECEIPLRVYPGNTAFKATDVVFDV